MFASLRAPTFCEGGGAWSISDPDENCEDHCTSEGWTCSNSAMEAHNADVDSSAEVIAIVTNAGYSTSGSCQSSNSISRPERAPQFKGSECTYSEASKPSSDFSCTKL